MPKGKTLLLAVCLCEGNSMCSLCERTYALLYVRPSEQVMAMFITTTRLLGLTHKNTYVRSHKLHILFHSHKHTANSKVLLFGM